MIVFLERFKTSFTKIVSILHPINFVFAFQEIIAGIEQCTFIQVLTRFQLDIKFTIELETNSGEVFGVFGSEDTVYLFEVATFFFQYWK